MNILKSFGDEHMWPSNWSHYAWTSSCQVSFIANLICSHCLTFRHRHCIWEVTSGYRLNSTQVKQYIVLCLWCYACLKLCTHQPSGDYGNRGISIVLNNFCQISMHCVQRKKSKIWRYIGASGSLKNGRNWKF